MNVAVAPAISNSVLPWTCPIYQSRLREHAQHMLDDGWVPIPVTYYPKGMEWGIKRVRGRSSDDGAMIDLLSIAKSGTLPNWRDVADAWRGAVHAMALLPAQRGLTWLDIDDGGEAAKWIRRANAKLMQLPRCETSRGRLHVVAKLVGPTYSLKPTVQADLLATGLVVVPPSINRNSRHPMSWTVPLRADLPPITLDDLLADPSYKCRPKNPVLNRPKMNYTPAGYNGFSSLSVTVEQIARQCIPERSGKRLESLRKLTRMLKAVRLDWPDSELRDAVLVWWELARTRTRERSPEKSVAYVKMLAASYVDSANGVLEAVAALYMASPRDRSVESYYRTSKSKIEGSRVAAVFRAFAEWVGDVEFFVSVGDVARLTKLPKTTVWHRIRRLEEANVLKCVKRGVPRRGSDASIYRYLGTSYGNTKSVESRSYGSVAANV